MRDAFTPANLLIGIVAALAGYSLFEFLRKRSEMDSRLDRVLTN